MLKNLGAEYNELRVQAGPNFAQAIIFLVGQCYEKYPHDNNVQGF